MRKFYSYIVAAILMAGFIGAQSNLAVGQTKTDPTYKLTQVTSVSGNNKYVFVRDGHALSNSVNSSDALQTVSSYSTTSLEGTESYVWKLESATGGFYLKNLSLSSNTYLNNASKTSVAFGNASSIWSIEFTNGVALISNTSNSDRFLGDAGKGTPNHTYKAYATSNLNDYQHDFTVYLLEEETDEPSINVTPTSLTGLSYNHGNGPSAAKSFTVSGTNLTANISITAPTHYEICTTQNGTYSGSITLTQSAGSVSNTPIYVRLRANQNVGDYNSENVALSSSGATTKNVSLSGTVSGYTVTYDCNDGTSNCPDNENNVPSGSYTINSTAPSRTNYSFGGWNDGTTTYAAGAAYTLTGDVTFTAQWTPNTYDYTLHVTGADTEATATLSVGGETLSDGDKIGYNAVVTINVSVNSGYGYSISVKDSGNNDVSVDDDNKFSMPASAVTITVTTVVDPYLKAKLTGTNMSNMSNAGTGYGTLKSITIAGLIWSTTGYQTTNYKNMIQLNTGYIKLPEFNGKIISVAFDVTDATATSFSEGSNTTNRSLYFRESDGGQNKASGGGSSTNHITIDLSQLFYNTGYIQASGALRIWNITVTYRPYGNFIDIDPSGSMPSLVAGDNYAVPSNMSTENLTIPATAGIVVKSGATLTVTGTLTNNGTAANLVVLDGGQLIMSNAVNATVQKSITGFGSNDKTGWNLIASPINNAEDLAPTNVTNMLSNTYDLYRLNPSTSKWENYKESTSGTPNAAAGFNLENGRGYLYANSNDVTLSFAGTVKPFTTAGDANQYDLADGWNLVGNPYTFNVYSSKSFYKITTEEGVDKIITASEPEDAVVPCKGIVVNSVGTGKITFTTPATQNATGNNGNINLVLSEQVVTRGGSNSTTLDNAIVSFNEGTELEKFYFMEQDANIYIPQGAEEYAIVSAEARGELPVNFKAAKDGEYTLTVNAKDVEMNYLHLIDNLTGADVDLLATPSYTFTARTTDYASRFRLVFGTNNENGASTSSATFAYVSNGQIIVDGTGTLQVIDVLGRIIFTQEITTANGQLPTANYKSGVYVLRLINGSDVKTQKIIVK